MRAWYPVEGETSLEGLQRIARDTVEFNDSISKTLKYLFGSRIHSNVVKMFRAMVKKWGESDDLEKISITAVGDAPSPKIEIRGLFAEDAEGKSFEVMMSRSTLRFGGLGNPLLSFITAKDCKGKGKVVYEPVGEQHIGECGDYVNEFHFDIDSDDDPQITTPVVIRIIVALENVLPAGAGEDQGRTPVNVFQMRVLKGERK